MFFRSESPILCSKHENNHYGGTILFMNRSHLEVTETCLESVNVPVWAPSARWEYHDHWILRPVHYQFAKWRCLPPSPHSPPRTPIPATWHYSSSRTWTDLRTSCWRASHWCMSKNLKTIKVSVCRTLERSWSVVSSLQPFSFDGPISKTLLLALTHVDPPVLI